MARTRGRYCGIKKCVAKGIKTCRIEKPALKGTSFSEKEMGKQETKQEKKEHKEIHRKTENKKLLCAKSASKRWTTNSHCQIYTRLTHSANIHLGA